MRTLFAPLFLPRFTLIHRRLPKDNIMCVPRVTRLGLLCWSETSLLLHLPHLRELEVGEYSVTGAAADTSTLPARLEKLNMNLYSNHRPLQPGELPDSIRELSINTSPEHGAARFSLPVGVLPASLTSLCLRYPLAAPLAVGSLPPLLTDLYYSDSHPLDPDVLPPSLTRLTLTEQYACLLTPATLPQSLTELKITGYCMNDYRWSLQPGVLPASLIRLTLDGNGQSIPRGVIPASLRYFKLEESDFNEPLDGVFPADSCLEEFVLEAVYEFNQSILPLPATLTSLDMRGAAVWNQPALQWKLHFPRLQRLQVHKDYLRSIVAAMEPASAPSVTTAKVGDSSSPLAAPLVDCVTSDLGRPLGLCFYPHRLHSLARVSRAFSRWVASSLLAHDRWETEAWQRARRRLVEEREAVVAARAGMSEEERAEVDEQLHEAWDGFTYPPILLDENSGHWHEPGPPPLADAIAHVDRMRQLVGRGAKLQSSGHRCQRGREAHRKLCASTADCYRKLLIDGPMQQPRWGEEEAQMAALVLAALRLMWTSNPHLLGDSYYLGGGASLGLLRLLFLPVVQRYAENENWELRIQSQQQADVLFDLCSLVALHCHINEEDDSMLPNNHYAGDHEGTFVSLLYGAAAPCLIPHLASADCYELNDRPRIDYRPINDLHRHQQRSLTRLVFNHYHTATHGLTFAPYQSLTPVQRIIRRQFEQDLIHCVRHLDQHARPDLTRLWLPYMQ